MTDMEISYLGGAWTHGFGAWEPPGGATWSGGGPAGGAALRRRGAACRLFAWDGLALLLRGYARPAGSSGPLDPERVAEGLRCHYLEHGELDVDGLEGGFTVALLDAAAGRVLLYRNLVGAGFTYYHARPGGLLFGGNLADLDEASGDAARPNEAALPTFFLYRCVPGPQTLFDGFYRLLPGEQLEWDQRGLRKRQRHTFATLTAAAIPDNEALDRLEETMARVLADCAAQRPVTA
jgi:hypothetical protein